MRVNGVPTRDGFFSFHNFSRIVSSGASMVAYTVRSTRVSVATSIADHDEDVGRDECCLRGGFFSFRNFSRIVSSGASIVAYIVRSAGVSVVASIANNDEDVDRNEAMQLDSTMHHISFDTILHPVFGDLQPELHHRRRRVQPHPHLRPPNAVEDTHRLEEWLNPNNRFQPQYVVSEAPSLPRRTFGGCSMKITMSTIVKEAQEVDASIYRSWLL